MLGMGDIMRQAQEMQEKMTRIQRELGSKTVSASSGGGMVTVVCSGVQEIRSVSIDKGIADADDVEMLQDLVLAAVNEALRLSRELAAQEMGTLAGSFAVPGLFP